MVFKGRGKPKYPEKNLSEQGQEPTTNSEPTYDAESGNQTWAMLVGGECCAIPSPTPEQNLLWEDIM